MPGPLDRPPRILLVDDEEDFRFVVRTMLADRGCTIEEAGSAEEAIACIAAASFDAVLLDNALPGMQGTDVAARLAGDARAPRVFLFSTWLNADFEDQARGLGVAAVDKLDLVAQLDRIVEAVAAAAADHADDG